MRFWDGTPDALDSNDIFERELAPRKTACTAVAASLSPVSSRDVGAVSLFIFLLSAIRCADMLAIALRVADPRVAA